MTELAVILALVAAPAAWDAMSLNPPMICQLRPGGYCLALTEEDELLLMRGGDFEAIPEPGATEVWDEASRRVAEAGPLRRDREERRRTERLLHPG